ncbi:MAG: HIRAN domain-containing protein, partial [Ostreibacterium sp.]
NAIEVWTKKQQKLGYVPKKDNVVIASLMDQHCEVSALIESIFTTAWEPITIKISMGCPK